MIDDEGLLEQPMVAVEESAVLEAASWRLAKSLSTLLGEANAYAPHRSRRIDGTIGDAAHAARSSRHNPYKGVVTALDLTHDPAGGFDAHAIARKLTQHPHPNLYYIISNRQAAYRKEGFVWRKYGGSHPHDKHIHVAVGWGPDSAPFSALGQVDDTSAWGLSDTPEIVPGSRDLRLDDPMMRGSDVLYLQEKLEACWISPKGADGVYGPDTRDAMMLFQNRRWPTHPEWWHGIVDANNWRELTKSQTAAQYIDALIHEHHPKSPITGEMVWACRQWYGLYPVWALAILGAETSLGDPVYSPEMVAHSNFGCVKARDKWQETKWGELATGTFEVPSQPGVKWLAWPDAWTGIQGWGRLMKLEYLALLKSGGLAAAYRKYYGANVAEFERHMAEVKQLEASFLGKLLLYTGGVTR